MQLRSNHALSGLIIISTVFLASACVLDTEDMYIEDGQDEFASPQAPGQSGERGSECAADIDCSDGFCGWTPTHARVCKPWSMTGELCEGFMPLQHRSVCHPGLTCVQIEQTGDLPGTCQPTCSEDTDCESGYCGETPYNGRVCMASEERDGETTDCTERQCRPFELACSIENDGHLDYRYKDSATCTDVKILCPEGSEYFANECGCGCTLPERGFACAEGQCAAGLTCMTYYGVAGSNGPEFSSCEIPCQIGKKDLCPDDEMCVRISDGPGEVCMP